MTVIHRIALATFISFALSVAMASHSIAQQQQLIGTWLLVSEITEFPDGRRLEGFGGEQKGILMFDGMGHYSSQLTGASRIKFASTRLQGTPEENKGVSAGSLAHFGTYSVDATGKTLTFHVERSSFPNWDDTDQKWSVIKLAGDDLTLGVARTTSGGKAELVYKRAK
ncbi:MAG: lipocalin-like domain-containing protein [Hyphomicrobiales bacterium]|nr:lipocalin-like domain-containing protein [Hyphomicrobiales bacterium]